MSYDLRIWEQPADRPSPATLEDAVRAVLALESKRPGINSKFVALGRAMAERYTTYRPDRGRDPDAVWMSDPAEEAATVEEAVWVVSVPPDDRARIAFFVMETAASLGLNALDAQFGLVILPDGRVLPEESQTLWREMRGAMDAEKERPPKVTKATVRKAVATLLRESVRGHGFLHDPSNDRVDVAFIRPTSAGLQSIELNLDGSIPRLECSIYCCQRNEQVEGLHEAVFGSTASRINTFAFNAGAFIGIFNSGIPFANKAEMKAIFELVEAKSLPAMKASSTLAGMNELMNCPDLYPLEYEHEHPLAPRSLAEHLRGRSLRPLIVAWLVRDPRFGTFVDECRELMSRRHLDVANLDKLLVFLRDQGRPDELQMSQGV